MFGNLPALTPMAPTLTKPFHRPGWVYEEKVDGWRMVAYKTAGAVRLISRNGIDHTTRFPKIVAMIMKLPSPSLVIDGEVAVYDEKHAARSAPGRPAPRALHHRQRGAPPWMTPVSCSCSINLG